MRYLAHRRKAFAGGVETITASMMNLNGSNQYLTLSDNAAYDVNNVSVSLWIHLDSGPTFARILCERWNTSTNNRSFTLQYDWTSNDTTFLISTNGSSATTATHNQNLVGSLYHIACTYDGTNIKIYINGTEQASVAKTGNVHQSSEPITIGGRAGGSLYVDGAIAFAYVFDKGLSASEVAELYNLGVPSQPWAESSALRDSYLVALPLNDGVASGREFEDYSGNDNDPSENGSPTITGDSITIVKSLVYDTYSFNGTNQHITFPSDASLALTNAGAISLWFKMPASITDNFIYMLANWSGATGYFEIFYQKASDTARAIFRLSGGLQFIDSSALNRDMWHHLVATYDGTTCRLYIDGVEQGTATGGTNFLTQHTTWEIGDNSPNANAEFEGNLTQVMLVTRNLSSSDVLTLYNQNAVKDYDSLPSSITDDVGFCFEMTSNDNSLTDLSGNGNNGTANGGVTSDGDEIDWDDT